MDSIDLSGVTGEFGGSGVDWTVSLEQGEFVSLDESSLTLSNDADGEIVLSDGTTISFHDIESIQF